MGCVHPCRVVHKNEIDPSNNTHTYTQSWSEHKFHEKTATWCAVIDASHRHVMRLSDKSLDFHFHSPSDPKWQTYGILHVFIDVFKKVNKPSGQTHAPSGLATFQYQTQIRSSYNHILISHPQHPDCHQPENCASIGNNLERTIEQ